jgi:hypothetical protein
MATKKKNNKAQKSDEMNGKVVADSKDIVDVMDVAAESDATPTLTADPTSTSAAEDFYSKLAKTEIQYGRGNNKALFKGDAKLIEAVRAITEGKAEMPEYNYQQAVLLVNAQDIARIFICKLAKETAEKPEAERADATTALVNLCPKYWRTFAVEMTERYTKNN